MAAFAMVERLFIDGIPPQRPTRPGLIDPAIIFGKRLHHDDGDFSMLGRGMEKSPS
jgi:hypothetical protein